MLFLHIKNFKILKNFLSLSNKKNFNELLNIDGIGETQINSIKFFLNNTNIKVLNKLDKILRLEDASKIKKLMDY